MCLSREVYWRLVVSDRKRNVECEVPHCRGCASKALRWMKYRALFVLAVILLFGLALKTLGRPELLAVVLSVGGIVGVVLWAFLHSSPALRVSSLSRGGLLFRFRSREYAREFLELNPSGFEPEALWRWRRALGIWVRPFSSFLCCIRGLFGSRLPVRPCEGQGFRAVVGNPRCARRDVHPIHVF